MHWVPAPRTHTHLQGIYTRMPCPLSLPATLRVGTPAALVFVKSQDTRRHLANLHRALEKAQVVGSFRDDRSDPHAVSTARNHMSSSVAKISWIRRRKSRHGRHQHHSRARSVCTRSFKMSRSKSRLHPQPDFECPRGRSEQVPLGAWCHMCRRMLQAPEHNARPACACRRHGPRGR